MENIKHPADIEGIIAIPTGKYEQFGVGIHGKPIAIGQPCEKDIGTYCSNNGVTAVVGPDKKCYIVAKPKVIDVDKSAYELLEEAGYTTGGFWVPHSNSPDFKQNFLDDII